MVHSPDPSRNSVSDAARRPGAMACRNQDVPSCYHPVGVPRPVRQTRAKAFKPAFPESIPPVRALERTDLVPEARPAGATLRRATSPATTMIVSRGCTLIVGDQAAEVCHCADQLSPWLECLSIVVTPEAATPSVEISGPHRILKCRRVAVSGHFGAFRVGMIGRKGWTRLERFVDAPSQIDLVLDLTAGGVYQGERVPSGYFAAARHADDLAEALVALPELVGAFEKKRFIAQDPEPCGHAHTGLAGCRQCQRVCPSGAVLAGDMKPHINPLACEGCGACASACPAGRLHFDPLPREDLLTALRLALESQPLSGAPVLALFQGAPGGPLPEKIEPPPHIKMVPLGVPEIGGIGLDVILTALAYGAGGVLVLMPSNTPRRLINNLRAQVHWAGLILCAIGRSAHSIHLSCEGSGAADRDEFWRAVEGSRKQAGFSPFHDKRTLIRLAVDGLREHDRSAPYAVGLPADAPFGTIEVDSHACTLCGTCAAACAQQALQWDQELQELKFVEARCTQCGLCVKVCPQQAVEAFPRFLLDRRISETAVMLNDRESTLPSGCQRSAAR